MIGIVLNYHGIFKGINCINIQVLSQVHLKSGRWLLNNNLINLKANEEELNRIFIEIYGLQNELTPEVDGKDMTVLKSKGFESLCIRQYVSHN